MSSSGFTVPQLKVLAALVQGSSVTAAARAAGLHRTTIHNWCRTDSDFRTILDDSRNSRAGFIQDRLYDLAGPALDALQRIIDHPETSTSQRLKAALTVINSAAAHPRRLPVEEVAADEYNKIADDIENIDEITRQQELDEADPAEQVANIPDAAGSSPEIHHFSSLFITKDENSSPEPQPAPPQIPRSAPCPCGSGNKFKRCCGRDAPPVLTAAA